MTETPWTKEEFEKRLRAFAPRYHINHPFQKMMHSGELTREQVQGWVLNRFYYQVRIPIKDSILLSKIEDRDTRRQWIQRIIDHDGREGSQGGIEAWIRLGEATGLEREQIISLKHVLPGVRFAVDAYVNFVRNNSWEDAVCSSLTELFAPTIHRQRLASWPEKYPWIKPEGLTYFQSRLGQAHRDVEHGLGLTLGNYRTFEEQEGALGILQFKLDVLWSMLDAMTMAYIHNTPPYFNISMDETASE